MKQAITKTFTAASSSAVLLCRPGDVLAWVEDGTFDTVSWAIVSGDLAADA